MYLKMLIQYAKRFLTFGLTSRTNNSISLALTAAFISTLFAPLSSQAYSSMRPAAHDKASDLTPAQWQALFRTAAKRIVTLQVQAIIRSRIYTTKTEAKMANEQMRLHDPKKWWKSERTVSGYRMTTRLVRLTWEIPDRLVYARRIQIGGYLDELPSGKLKKGLSNASIWVVGRKSVWYADPGPGWWGVWINKRQSARAQMMWPLRSQVFGLSDLAMVWTPFLHSTPIRFRLIRQKFDPATGLSSLTFGEIKSTFSNGIGKGRFFYELKLSGGLRIYRETFETIRGPHGNRIIIEGDFARFRKSSGVWFPTRIRERTWLSDGRVYSDDRLTISHLAVNKIFPPHTFRYTPPFGAGVYDERTSPGSFYYIGSKNPNVPPSTARGMGTKRSGKK